MGRLGMLFALFSMTLILSEFALAAPSEDVQRTKRSPQMPEMPQPPAPPGGFPSPPMPFKRIARQISEDVPEGPPGDLPPMSVQSASWMHPHTRIQRDVHQSEAMKSSRSGQRKKMLNSRIKREARGTGGKLSTRGG
ncbi:uncharacterized protein LOC135704119 [Ochlerotatus camptorhynchus]|uniref:uncharacterized protein LOC135704119 n=1 Tax=Ochlerotatus camptorhynchus TaxID=644619 RepID=UPI0031D1ADD2